MHTVFAQPGTAIWWFALGGAFTTGPSSAAGICFAAVANSALWLTLFVAIRGVYCGVRRWRIGPKV